MERHPRIRKSVARIILIANEATRSLMTLEEIDRNISSWNQRLAATANNLLELQSDPTYQVLTGSGGATPVQLTGETAKRVLPPLKQMETIFHQFSLVQSVVDRAVQLRKDLRPVFGRDQTLREIEALLLGESVQLPADAVSLKDRTLLSGAKGTLAVRPEALLASMGTAFSEARDAVLLVSGAWDELAHEVDAAESEMRRLWAANCDQPQAIPGAEKMLDALKAQVQSDPLTARAELKSKLLPALAGAARELDARLRVKREMAAAHEMLTRLQATEAEIEAAAAARRDKILGDGTRPAAAAQSNALSVWLGRLEARKDDERAETIARGLENWRLALNKALEQSVQALQQERAPLETRSELRGRLDALKAKARVYGVAEDAALAGLAGQAEELLYARPTDLARSAAAVAAYERRLALPAPSKQKGPDSGEERR
jgi:hypothetical protein